MQSQNCPLIACDTAETEVDVSVQDLADDMMQQARKLVAAEWLPAPLSCDLTFQLIKMLSEQARCPLRPRQHAAADSDASCMTHTPLHL